jgi:hypothetical protein
MGAQLGACKRKKADSVGQAAAGVGVGARWGVRMGEIGEEGKLLTGGGRLLCRRFKSNQTDPKQFKQI